MQATKTITQAGSVSKRSTLSVLFALLVPFLAIGRYGKADDYAQWLSVKDFGFNDFVSSSYSFGRPLTFAVNGLLYGNFGVYPAFVVSRILSVGIILLIGIALTNVCFASHAKKPTLLVTGSILSIPGIPVMLTWAQGTGHLCGLLIALFAIDVAKTPLPRNRRLSYVASFSVSFFYQPFALLAISLLLLTKVVDRRNIRTTGNLILSFLMGLIGSYLLATLSPDTNPRGSLSLPNSGKFDWLVSEFLPRAIQPWILTGEVSVLPRPFRYALVLLFVVSLGYLLLTSSTLGKLSALTAVAIPIFPSIFLSENWASSRSLISVHITMFAVIFAFINKYRSLETATHSEGKSKKRKPGAIALVVLICTVVPASFSQIGIAYDALKEPSLSEQRELERFFARDDVRVALSTASRVVVEQSWWSIPNERYVAYDEHGVLASSSAYGAISIARIESSLLTNLPFEFSPMSDGISLECSDVGVLDLDDGTIVLNPLWAFYC